MRTQSTRPNPDAMQSQVKMPCALVSTYQFHPPAPEAVEASALPTTAAFRDYGSGAGGGRTGRSELALRYSELALRYQSIPSARP